MQNWYYFFKKIRNPLFLFPVISILIGGFPLQGERKPEGDATNPDSLKVGPVAESAIFSSSESGGNEEENRAINRYRGAIYGGGRLDWSPSSRYEIGLQTTMKGIGDQSDNGLEILSSKNEATPGESYLQFLFRNRGMRLGIRAGRMRHDLDPEGFLFSDESDGVIFQGKGKLWETLWKASTFSYRLQGNLSGPDKGEPAFVYGAKLGMVLSFLSMDFLYFRYERKALPAGRDPRSAIYNRWEQDEEVPVEIRDILRRKWDFDEYSHPGYGVDYYGIRLQLDLGPVLATGALYRNRGRLVHENLTGFPPPLQREVDGNLGYIKFVYGPGRRLSSCSTGKDHHLLEGSACEPYVHAFLFSYLMISDDGNPLEEKQRSFSSISPAFRIMGGQGSILLSGFTPLKDSASPEYDGNGRRLSSLGYQFVFKDALLNVFLNYESTDIGVLNEGVFQLRYILPLAKRRIYILASAAGLKDVRRETKSDFTRFEITKKGVHFYSRYILGVSLSLDEGE